MVGGLIGRITTNEVTNILFEYSYCSNQVTGGGGAVIGSIDVDSKVSFNNVYYNDQINIGLHYFGSGNTQDGSLPLAFDCPNLYDTISKNYDNKIWGGDNLLCGNKFYL